LQRQALLDDGLTTKNILPCESVCHSMSDAIFFTKTGIIALGDYKKKNRFASTKNKQQKEHQNAIKEILQNRSLYKQQLPTI